MARRYSKAWHRQENESRLLQLGIGFDDAWRLQQIARSLHAAAEKECNVPMTEAQQARHDKRVERLENEAVEIAKRHGFNLYVQGGQRGWPLYLWKQEDLDAYNARGGATQYKIDACYSTVGTAVCPL